jgi:hypothetical protein
MKYSDKTFDIDDAPLYDNVDVMDLATGKVYTYCNTNPLKACALAYIQMDRGNFNTWSYGSMVVSGNLVSLTMGGVQHITEYRESPITVSVGNFSAFKDGRRIS